MNDFLGVLDRTDIFLRGRVATSEEILLLSEQLESFPGNQEFQFLLQNYRVIGMNISLSSHEDASGKGVEMEWMIPKDIIDEASNFYPGIIVFKEGYMPIGSCLFGSGDPYFVKLENGIWKVFRIMHDFNVYSKDMVEYVATLKELIIAAGRLE